MTSRGFNVFLDNYRIPNIPHNGWWQQWPDKKDIQADNNEIHLDIGDREGKLLIYRGENWQPEVSTIPMETSAESNENPTKDKLPVTMEQS